MPSRYSQFEILTAGGALWLCLVFVCVFSEASAIEDDVGTRVSDAVKQENLFWASVEAHGQSVVLTGAAPAHQDKVRAGEVAASVRGVTSVENLIEVIGSAGTCQSRLDRYLADEKVTFKTGRPEISADSLPLLKLLASVLRNCNTRVEVAAHTDATGDANVNQKLSERRAAEVVKYLVRSGVDAGTLVAAGYGESQPLADNDAPDGRQANRRVEFRVLGNGA